MVYMYDKLSFDANAENKPSDIDFFYPLAQAGSSPGVCLVGPIGPTTDARTAMPVHNIVITPLQKD